jgi:hypothetical protein
VVTWSAAVPVAAKGAELLAADGIKVDLIDLRKIWPWDDNAALLRANFALLGPLTSAANASRFRLVP